MPRASSLLSTSTMTHALCSPSMHPHSAFVSQWEQVLKRISMERAQALGSAFPPGPSIMPDQVLRGMPPARSKGTIRLHRREFQEAWFPHCGRFKGNPWGFEFPLQPYAGRIWILGSSNETIGRITLFIAFSFFSV